MQFVETMACQPLSHSNEGVRTMYMVIGTHRDLMHECDETLAQRNERLEQLLLPLVASTCRVCATECDFVFTCSTDASTPELHVHVYGSVRI